MRYVRNAKKRSFFFQIIDYSCGICQDLTFKTRNACQNHLREQHSGISWKCGKCHKIFRRNNNPHQCRAKEADYYLFSTITGASREDAAVELELFEAKAYRSWVTVVTHGTTFTTPEAPLPHAPAQKRTQPAPLFNGKRQRHLSSSTSSLSTSSSSSRESSAERHLADIGHNTEVEMTVSSLTSYHDATGLDEPSVEGEIVVMGEEDKREREEMERKKRFEKERKEKEEKERREKEQYEREERKRKEIEIKEKEEKEKKEKEEKERREKERKEKEEKERRKEKKETPLFQPQKNQYL